MPKRLLLIAVQLVLMAAPYANAVPYYTAYFEGITTEYHDYSTESFDSTRVGLPLSGWVTFDFGNGDLVTSVNPITNEIQYVERQSGGGCTYVVNGACDNGGAPIAPVIIAYSVVTPFSPPQEIGGPGPGSLSGGFAPVPNTAYYGDTSFVVQSQGYSNDWEQAYQVVRSQLRRDITGEPGNYVMNEHFRQFSLLLLSLTTNLFGSIEDLAATPNLAASSVNDVFFTNVDSTRFCSDWQNNLCPSGSIHPGSFAIHGTLTSLTVVPGPATPRRLSEPGTLALLMMLVVGMVLTPARAQQ